MGPYLVFIALAALGLALGWRLTPAPSERIEAHALARLLQLTITAIGLVALVLLMIPFFGHLGAIECTAEAEKAGQCLIGVHERGLFGGAAFALLVGVAFAFVLRKGVLDLPVEASQATSVEPATSGEPATSVEPTTSSKQATAVEPTTSADDPRDEAEGQDGADEPPATEEPPAAEPPATEPPAAEPQGSHRRLEGPVFQAFVDDQTVDLEVAIATAAKRLRSERVAVVFSRGASKNANEALLELAEVFDAYRYVLEGTAAATEGLPTGDTPELDGSEIAGPDARHAMQLALDLAGALIETVFLLDTRVAFPPFVLGRLTELQSVCIAHAHDDVSAACQVVLPGTNPGEREGELIDDGGGINQRRPREWLVRRIIAELRDAEPPAPSEAAPSERVEA
jgi:hypothetical protein